jgi:hypothetical protein
MSGFPAIKLNQLYSIQFYEALNIIFETLDMVDMDSLETAIKERPSTIVIVPYQFQIDLSLQQLVLCGHKLNETTYMCTNASGEKYTNMLFIPYTCSNNVIWQGIEYLYHLIKSK